MMDDTTVVKLLKKNRVFSVTELSEWLGCSLPTCRRRLKKWQAYTSYNHNGRYYALPSIPRFDSDGLWHYQGISFSRHGNLKQTVVHFVSSSSSGLSAADIGNILRVDALSFLSHFQDNAKLYREKIGRRYIWFSADVNVRNRQKPARIAFESEVSVALLAPEDAIKILVDLLHHQGSTIKDICRRLGRKHGLNLTQDKVHAFLAMYDLLKKTVR